MPKFKSYPKPVFKHLEKFGVPSDEDFALIKEFLPSEISKEDIFVYSVKLCDNLVDREGEFFSDRALEQLVDMFKGTTGIYNHDWKSGNQHSRIYKVELFVDLDNKNESSDPYKYIVGYAYTLNNEKNKSLIEDIKAGILKEVSIGFNFDVATEITLDDGRKVTRIDNITDVYEWSFVAVPAQKFAGVIKSFNHDKEVSSMNWKEALVKLKSLSGVDLSVVSVIESAVKDFEQQMSIVPSLQAKIKSLEDEVAEKTKKVKELEEELITATLEHAINDVLSDFELVSDTAEELARSIVEKSISIDEDGAVQGVEEVKSKLKSDYPFLFKNVDSGDDGDEEDTVSTKSFTKVTKKGIDFSKTSTFNTKSVIKTKKPLGLHFE